VDRPEKIVQVAASLQGQSRESERPRSDPGVFLLGGRTPENLHRSNTGKSA
jgi:hypothetical protein